MWLKVRQVVRTSPAIILITMFFSSLIAVEVSDSSNGEAAISSCYANENECDDDDPQISQDDEILDFDFVSDCDSYSGYVARG